MEIVTGDIREASQIFKPVFFDVITTNPPYMPAEHGIRNADSARAAARHEVLCTLDDILRESMRLLQDKGRFYMIHRPFRLTEILIKMNHYKIEPKRIRFIHPGQRTGTCDGRGCARGKARCKDRSTDHYL